MKRTVFGPVVWALTAVWLTAVSGVAAAAEIEARKLADNVYALVGEMAQRSPQNLGNNATFGLIVTSEGAVLVDPGGSFEGARQLHTEIKKISDQPVKYVINTGGQDHRWLGNGYWRKQGAKIIASTAAVEDHKERASQQLTMLTRLIGKDKLAGTDPAYADITFDESHELEFGGVQFELRHAGHAHTPGDSFVRLPARNIIFSGDIIYLDRLLGVGPQSSSGSWIEAFRAIEKLNPAVIVPGHGFPADLEKARKQTFNYLINLRKQIGAHIESGGDMQTAGNIDQLEFQDIKEFDSLARRNALAVFAEMEFE